MKVYSGGGNHNKQKKKWYIPVMAIALVFVLGTQLISLYSKLNDYRAREAALASQLEDAEAVRQELIDYEAYTHTDEFIRNTARNKLGMVMANETIFKAE